MAFCRGVVHFRPMDTEAFETAEAMGVPTVRQLSVFLEERPGQLVRLAKLLDRTHVRILGLSIVHSIDCAVLRLLVDEPDEASQVLRGGGFALRPSLAREFFGRTNFGTVFGSMMGIGILGSIAGPPLAGWVFDNWGSYQYIWFVFAGLAAAALISVLTIPPVSTKVQPADKARP